MKQIRNILVAALALCALGSCTRTLDTDNTLDPLGPVGNEAPITLTTPVVSVEGNSSVGFSATSPKTGEESVTRAGNDITPYGKGSFTLQLIDSKGNVVMSNGVACQAQYYLTNDNDSYRWQLISGSITVTGGERNYRARAWGTTDINYDESLSPLYMGMTGAIAVKADGTFAIHFEPLTARVRVALKDASGSALTSDSYRILYQGLKTSNGIKETDGTNSLLPSLGGMWTLKENPEIVGVQTIGMSDYTVTRPDILPALYPRGIDKDGIVTSAPGDLFTINNSTNTQWHVPFPSYTATDGTVHYRPLDFKAGHTYTFNILLDGQTASIQSVTVAGFEDTDGEEEIVMGEQPADYEISDEATLIAFREAVNAGSTTATTLAVVTKDIILTSAWTMGIGTGTKYHGTFDGRGKAITLAATDGNVELFSNVPTSATVKNITVNGNGSTQNNISAIANSNNGTIYACSITGYMVDSEGKSGAMVGVNNGQVYACSATNCTVSGMMNSGAVVGENNGQVYACSATNCTVSGMMGSGAVVGWNDGTVTSCIGIGCNINNVTVNGLGTTIASYAASTAAGIVKDGTTDAALADMNTALGKISGFTWRWQYNASQTGKEWSLYLIP